MSLNSSKMLYVTNNSTDAYIENIHKFAKQFVQDVIEEAVKQSSKTTWLIHCSEHCHRLNLFNGKKSNSYICWTPESIRTISTKADNILKTSITDVHDGGCSCNSVEGEQAIKGTNGDLYTLSDGSVSNDERIFSKPPASRNSGDERFKPETVHSINVFKGGHPKTLSDFKLFFIHLYSSTEVSSEKLSSENSVCTKYRNNETSTSDGLYNRKKRKKDENLRIMYIKGEKDRKHARKCNRIKRCNFFNLRHSFCKVFRCQNSKNKNKQGECSSDNKLIAFKDRSLPSLPPQTCSCPCENDENLSSSIILDNVEDPVEYDGDAECSHDEDDYFSNDNIGNRQNRIFDFAANIEKVKDYGWYWGPMSSEAAEKLLENERDGSFIVRDSSDDRYIFSLTFKLSACIRHVRIEHGQGNFSFGNYTKFRSHTIVDFIEKAVLHSRSGRYLFFLHRRPILGPMRVQLLYPVSRFKHVQSLQHMCRFVILKNVRRDLIASLPLPKSLIEYLCSKDYYTEQNF